MIVFDLACLQNHVFEGWFASGEDYESQLSRGLVRCPICDEARVQRRPSAVSLHIPPVTRASAGASTRPDAGAGRSEPSGGHREADGGHSEPAPERAHPPTSAELKVLERALLAQVRAYVRSAEDVGTRFAEEARKIHHQEVEPRSIRGKATPQEADSLRDEGIEFHPLPPILIDEVH